MPSVQKLSPRRELKLRLLLRLPLKLLLQRLPHRRLLRHPLKKLLLNSLMRITKSYGTEGGFIVSAPELTEDLQKTEPVFIVFDELPVPFFIEEFSPKGSTKYYMKLEDVDSLEDAEELVGRDILLSEEDDDDSISLTGFTLFDQDKKEIGPITDFIEIPGNPCIEVNGTLVPCADECIIKVDSRKKRIYLNIAAGLLD